MSNTTIQRMLIDAKHTNESRMAIVDGSETILDYDFTTAAKPQIKGNIYLAKVTRVEPSLQAAFVEYGGNKQGFLPFAEIHPDYYQIPTADRQKLLAEEFGEDEEEDEKPSKSTKAENGEEDDVETLDSDDDIERGGRPQRRAHRRYKIQEVIKRGQILLVQVIKEERGNKGCSLSSYISIPGRYCVFMPNSPRGGGVSRKIPGGEDRRRLREVLTDLKLPKGMSVIIRTAGGERTRAEIKRDFDYLAKLWNQIRENALSATAPALVYEEGDLIKRSLRDLYHGDIEEVLVQGEEAHKDAKAFMRMLMPSHAPKVKLYKGDTPLFHAYGVEKQLASMMDPTVRLRSGGYVVMNATEALIAIDVNSGRSTSERNIEETATKTNMEAAREIARQLRLRDLAGLIVIDFIDMMDHRNRRNVERALKEALRADRAKIQVGRISTFGLLEMSRQRLRPSISESVGRPCEHCHGTGVMRSAASVAMQIVRQLEQEAAQGGVEQITVFVTPEVTLHLLNKMREALSSIESEHNVSVVIEGDSELPGNDYRVERTRGQKEDGRRKPAAKSPARDVVRDTSSDADEDEVIEADDAEAEGESASTGESRESREERKGRRRGRRGGRNRRRGERGEDRDERGEDAGERREQGDAAGSEAAPEDSDDGEAAAKPRGGRRRWGKKDDADAAPEKPVVEEAAKEPDAKDEKPARSRRKPAKAAAKDSAAEEKPKAEAEADAKPKRRAPAKAKSDAEATVKAPEPTEKAAKLADEKPAASKPAAKPAAPKEALPTKHEVVKLEGKPDGGDQPRRSGWWKKQA